MILPLLSDTSEGEEKKDEEKLVSSPLASPLESSKPIVNGATRTVVSPPVPSGVMVANPDIVTILHFNDVYNIEPRDQDPVGGASRFKTAIEERKHLNPMVLFSGDAFNPSLSKLYILTSFSQWFYDSVIFTLWTFRPKGYCRCLCLSVYPSVRPSVNFTLSAR